MPLGPPDYCVEVFQARLAKLQLALDAFHNIGDSQLETALLLLRSCLALPTEAFLLHVCPPCHVANSTRAFDTTIRHTLENIISGPISEWSWEKASLPSNKGGLNLRSASLHAPAAYLAFVNSSQSLLSRILVTYVEDT